MVGSKVASKSKKGKKSAENKIPDDGAKIDDALVSKKPRGNVLKPVAEANIPIETTGSKITEKTLGSPSASVPENVEFRSRQKSMAEVVRKKRVTGSKRADIIFPVSRMKRNLKKGRYASKIGTGKMECVSLFQVLSFFYLQVLLFT
jgi:hypothetical protein